MASSLNLAEGGLFVEEISLRPYQNQFIDDVRSEFRQNHRRVVGVAPCGAGKTIMTGWMIREVERRGKRAIFFVHRHELIKQTSETFERLGISHGIVSSGYKMQLEVPVQIASVQTLAKRLEKVPAPDFLICDECHHILANTYKKILDAYPDAFLLGVTATPQRMGGINLGDVFSSMVEGPTVDELIKLGNLTSFKYFSHMEDIDLHNVRIKFGEYVNSDLAKVMQDKRIIGNIVETYKRLAKNKSAICYCVNVKHSKIVAKAFRDAGISAAHCDGETPKKTRAKLMEDFRVGKIKILFNVAKSKNYQVGWVAIQALKFATSYEDCGHIAEVCVYKKGWAYYNWRDKEKKFSSEDTFRRPVKNFTRIIL